MKPSRYSILIIPDNEDSDRQFSITRKQMLSLIISLILMLCIVVFFIAYALPKLMQYNAMEVENEKFAVERVKIMELMQDLNRIEQMDRLIRKTLGSELELSSVSVSNDSAWSESNQMRSDKNNAVSYVDNIPSKYPVEGYITQKIRIDKLFKNQNHYGIDIAVKEGEPVYASASGFVVYSGWTYNFGNYIILYHGDDYFSIYGHNKGNFVETRDFVKRGEVIATTGGTGISSGPHLHFEIWKNGKAVDPLELFPKYKQKDISVNNYE
ncbi:M23 family metallopeptidase [bacterium]|nr:M23 family metallopeptidase [bacterium]